MTDRQAKIRDQQVILARLNGDVMTSYLLELLDDDAEIAEIKGE